MIEKTINLDNRINFITKNDDGEKITFIELFENDDIENFFKLDESYLKEKYESNDIILLQYGTFNSSPEIIDFSFSSGKIKKYERNIIIYDIPNLIGAIGSPIFLGNNNHSLIGIHVGKIEYPIKNMV